MKCQQCDLALLSAGDESSDAFAAVVEHVDHCSACQQQLDAMLSSSSDWQELASTLQNASASDLTLDSTSPTLALELELGNARDERLEGLPDAGLPALPALPAASHPELLGRLGRYDIERVIGQGGMGVVFRAYDSELHRVVAVKVLAKHLSLTAAARQRFAREARTAAAVLHPNVLPIHDVEAAGPTPYLVMQYVSGASLQLRVDRDGPLTALEAMRIAKQTAEALAAAHHQGLIHRDVKPANILLEDGTHRVVLGDFGLARTSDEASLTRTGIVAGTPHYMSPEQAHGETVSPRSDLFAVGSVMYFMLTGQPPFRGESAMAVLHCVCTKPHAPLRSLNPCVPKELADLIDRLLCKKPTGRPASAQLVAARIEELIARMQAGNLRIGPTPKMTRWWRQAVLAASLLLIVSLTIANRNAWELPDAGSPTGSVSVATDGASTSPRQQPVAQPATAARPRPPQDDSPASIPPKSAAQSRRSARAPAAGPTSPSPSLGSQLWLEWERQRQQVSAQLASEERLIDQQAKLGNLLRTPDDWAAEAAELANDLQQLEQSTPSFLPILQLSTDEFNGERE